MPCESSPHQLKPASLGVADIVFFVVAAAAPLGATLGAAPVVFAIGGAGAPGLYLIASVVLLLFAIGFAAMSRYVVSAGGFADIVSRGLGKKAGHMAAGVALLAYVCMLSGVYGQFAAFGADFITSIFNVEVDWRAIAFAVAALVALFGYLNIDLSARVLGVIMILEVLILLLFDIAVLMQSDFEGGLFQGFMPSQIISPGMGVALMFAFACFVGFESTTLYGEEAKNPKRTVPRATYVAILTIGGFYILTTWCIGLAYQSSDVQAAASDNFVNFVFDVNTEYVGAWSTFTMKILAITSIFAVLLSFHNALCRYLFSLARERFLPTILSHVHPRQSSPYIASIVLSCSTSLVLLAFMIGDADPIDDLFVLMVALGTLSVLTLQTMGAFAVLAFFRRIKERNLWVHQVLPGIGALGLLLISVLAYTNFSALSGVERGIVTMLPWCVLAVALLGALNSWRAVAKHGVIGSPAG
ncbi:APC family permease [Vreelandella nigrificans]|uniref:Amino acid permease n=1 Tax=Vreelandella nigrificans TaxID=2042704 RepID=A0A2A4HPY5_9GAMM|nr:APC family permease [Halomonas nigrificans]PCF96982.1 amino acid permease [Halomonas nigrificans]